MNIVVVHQQFLRPGEGGGSRFNEFARLWTEAGHRVTVIAGQISYISGERWPEYRGHWVRREAQNGVTVLRAYTPPTAMSSIGSRLWMLLSFTLSATWALLLLAPKPDIIIATSPQLVVAIPGVLGSLVRRCPLVFEVRDLWPETGITNGGIRSGSRMARLLYKLEAWAYRKSAAISVLTPAFRDSIVQRRLAPSEKIWFIPNGADFPVFDAPVARAEARAKYGWEGRFVLTYAGAHGQANNLMQLVRAAEALRDEPDILFVTVGGGAEESMLKAEVEQRGLTNLLILGNRPKEEMPELFVASDVGVAVLRKCDTFKTVYPNKVFDYLSARLPVLLAIDGIARDLIEGSQAGIFVEPEDTEAMVRAVRWLRDHPQEAAAMGERGCAYVREHFNRQTLGRRYLAHLEHLARNGR